MTKTREIERNFKNHILERRTITVRFTVPGIHRFPEAPDEVSYLRNPHRHIFHYEVEIDIFHDDREIEFHMFLNDIKNQYAQGTLECDYKSCEMLIDDLVEYLSNKYPNRTIIVSVYEDNENGATGYFVPNF